MNLIKAKTYIHCRAYGEKLSPTEIFQGCCEYSDAAIAEENAEISR
ncbi:hypothetical protein [Reinekea sp. G2M2-21]|nr:hypothetical protein [Reinekea sp. G2M2-21]